MARYKVKIGEEFEVEAFDVEEAKDVAQLGGVFNDITRLRTQVKLTIAILGLIVGALAVSTVIGLIDGTLNEVESVWAAAALPLGYVLKAYFDNRDA